MEPLLVVVVVVAVGLVCSSVVAGVVGDGAVAVAQSLGTSALSKQSADPIPPATPH